MSNEIWYELYIVEIELIEIKFKYCSPKWCS